MYGEATGSEFARKLLGYLQKADYRVAETGSEKDDIFRLRYDAYVREGTIDPNPSLTFHDDYDKFENCWVFGIYIDDELVSSIRCHVISPECPFGPAMDVFPDIVSPMVHKEGLTVIDPTRFVTKIDATKNYPEIPYLTLRAAYMMYEHFEADFCLATVRKEHVAFYKRVFLGEQICEPRPYPALNSPICLMRGHVGENRQKILNRYPIFESSLTERRMLFEPRDLVATNAQFTDKRPKLRLAS